MIAFLNADVRAQFHSLPIDKQREWMKMAEEQAKRGFTLRVLFIDQTDGVLEVSVRIDEKFD
jgi:hypothetical protein